MTLQLIQTKTLSASAASIEFTGIPQDATDLYIYSSLRSDRVAIVEVVKIEFNTVTTGYTYRELVGTGAIAESSTSNYTRFALIPGTTVTSNMFSNDFNYIPDYTSNAIKTLTTDTVYENNATASYQDFVANSSSGTAAITSLKLSGFFATNFIAGSMVSLYKVTKGSDRITTVA
jgi:hypothetical protein